jgi:cyclophilin family peptidyl-prolyl cis-trans isomerase
MKQVSVILLSTLLLGICFLTGCNGNSNQSVNDSEVAVIETTYGRIVIEFLPKEAPQHVENFKSLTREGFYNGVKFHRLVRDKTRFIAIQGGDPNTIAENPSTWGQGKPDQKKVPAEFSKTLKHVRGIVSAARQPNDPNSATSQFFICTSDQPAWDGQYSIFGRVVEGMNVVDAICRAPLFPKTDRPLDPVVMTQVSIVDRASLK